MAKQILEDATIMWGPHDFSAYANQVELGLSIDAQESTNFASGGWREYVAGLGTTTGSLSGFWDDADGQKDSDAFSGLASAPLIVSKTNPLAVGDVSYTLRGIRTTYKPGMGTVGNLADISMDFMADHVPLRPTVHHLATTISGSENATASNFGAVLAAQKMYAVLSIGGVTGSPTLDVVLESAATDTWPGTDRITFTQETSATARYQLLSLAGAITDTWWRAELTYGGTGSFSNVRILIYIG